MASRNKTQKAKDLANEVIKWSESNQATANFALNKLAEDLSAGSNYGFWVDLDPDSYVPNPESDKTREIWRKINLLSTLRNILVFSPIALTWASISVATSALAKYEQDNPESVTNFLQFWQQGFGYLNEFWRLSNVAIFDVALVILIIIMTAVIGILSQRAIQDEAREIKQLELSRSQLIFNIRVFFEEYKKPTVVQINRNTYLSTKSLANTAKNLSKIVSKLDSDLRKLSKTENLSSEIKQLNKNITKLKKNEK